MAEIESWALSVIDRVVNGQPIEDARVELKTQISNEYKAARRIAAHANTAHGESILWLIGVDQRKQMVVGASNVDFAKLWSGIKSYFNELAPSVIDVNVPFKDKTVLALLFATDRAPYVVKNPLFNKSDGGPVEFEVPWREGTSVCSATRTQLLQMLLPVQKLPLVEFYNADLSVQWDYLNKDALDWSLTASLYVVSHNGDEPVIFPFHRCEASIEFNNNFRMKLFRLNITPSSRHPDYRSPHVQSTGSEVIIRQAGMIHFEGSIREPCEGGDEPLSDRINKPVKACINLVSAHNNIPILIECMMEPVELTLTSLQRGDVQRWVC